MTDTQQQEESALADDRANDLAAPADTVTTEPKKPDPLLILSNLWLHLCNEKGLANYPAQAIRALMLGALGEESHAQSVANVLFTDHLPARKAGANSVSVLAVGEVDNTMLLKIAADVLSRFPKTTTTRAFFKEFYNVVADLRKGREAAMKPAQEPETQTEEQPMEKNNEDTNTTTPV